MGFPCKNCCLIVVDLLLLRWLICLLNLFWHIKREMSFLDSLYLVVFPNKGVSELGCLGFFSMC